MFYYPSYISHFHSFGCPLGFQLGSLRQKCDPGRCAQNSHKSRIFFFTCQTFSIFIRLSVPWEPDLDPCGENVVLAGARKIHIKLVCVLLPIKHFLYSSICLSPVLFRFFTGRFGGPVSGKNLEGFPSSDQVSNCFQLVPTKKVRPKYPSE